MEAALLGLFMLSACSFVVVLEHPASPVHRALPDALVRRLLMGLAMGSTAVALIYSPWGKRSGAHLNPSVTLTFARLRKVAPRDAAAYVAAQFAGGVLGVLAAHVVWGPLIAHPATNFAATLPGRPGVAVAFAAELAISFVLMGVVLRVSNHRRLAPLTGLCAGVLVATYITLEAPLSGMSMNPARTFGSAVSARAWTALWVYFTAPPLGMLAAAEVWVRLMRRGTFCAKLYHAADQPCIFCEYQGRRGRAGTFAGPVALERPSHV